MAFGQYLDNRIVAKLTTAFVVGIFVFAISISGAYAASPTADFQVSDNRDGSITFDASASTDSDGSITQYRWGFGDGNSGRGVNVTHCYQRQGTYDVILSVVDNGGEGDDMTAPVEVMSEPTCSSGGVIGNPVGDISSIPEFLEALLDRIVQIAIPIIIIFIIYSGFLFLAAQGNPEKISKAKKTLMWTLIGAAVIIGADILAKVIVGTITDLGQ